ncbi:MAG: hypothetical protein IJI21_00725 [Clostridia bacterium]|nr:hypothetical protein [Clostridia bacterium]
MKKFLSILLVLSLTLSVAGMAMAEELQKEVVIQDTSTKSSTPTTPTKTTVTETKTETTTTSTAAAAPAAPAPDHAQLKTNSAHLRETPGGKYNIGNDWIGAGTTLELAGDAVTVDGQTWIPVIYNGKVWYVADYLVNLVVGATTAPAKKTVTSAGSSSGWTGAEATADDGLKLEILGETTESASVFKAFQDAAAAGNVLSALPDDVKAKLASGVTQINEMVAAKFVGDVTKVTGSVLVNVRFSTLYSPAGEKVSVIINKAGAWTVVEGTIQGDGSISMTVTKDMLNTLKNDEFVIGVVSK